MSKSAKITLAQLSQTPSEKKMAGPEVERLLAEVTEGRAVLAATEAGPVGPDWTAADCAVKPGGPTRLMMGCDGVEVPLVTATEKAKRRANRRRRREARRRRTPPFSVNLSLRVADKEGVPSQRRGRLRPRGVGGPFFLRFAAGGGRWCTTSAFLFHAGCGQARARQANLLAASAAPNKVSFPLPCSLTGLVKPHHLDIRRKMADQRMEHSKEEQPCFPRSKCLTDPLSNVTIPFFENTFAEVALDRPPVSRPTRVR